MGKIKPISISFLIAIAITSCTHETDLTGLKDISFSSDIQPIIAGNCTQSGCHNGNAEFSLITYNDVVDHGHIKAGDAHGSDLYQAISNHGFEETMPPEPLPPLSTDQIKMVYLWIEQGAKNN